MPAARDDAPIPTRPRSRTTTRPMPSAAANSDAQPPIVPAPTTTRSARSATPAPSSAVERRGLDAHRDDAERRQPVERRPATDRPRGDLETGRARQFDGAAIE